MVWIHAIVLHGLVEIVLSKQVIDGGKKWPSIADGLGLPTPLLRGHQAMENACRGLAWRPLRELLLTMG